jgi:CrcB protein
VTTLWIALGGALGSVARYQIAEYLRPRDEGAVPLGTLFVNILGSLLLGVLVGVATRADVSPAIRLALGTGVLGGFTTYSAFNAETVALAQRGAWAVAATYVLATLLGGLLAGWLGWLGGRAIVSG